jgi:cyclopropane fatty-acyl-phospholipid synthase-like methyltransferase
VTTPPAAFFPGRGQHPHDIPADELQRALAEATRPELLRELASTARAVFGFFPNHYPHTLKYPWMLERLEPLEPGARVLDVGAGVSPMPVVLAQRGLRVECVDNSDIVRRMPVEADWNEWGFFDYAVVDVRIQSYHRDVREHVPAQSYDCIYSVCALAHMTRTEREETVDLIPQWLKPGGRVLLAVDLVPQTDFVWNISDGMEVAPGHEHGTTTDLFNWICQAGLTITEWTVRRAVHASRTDLLFVDSLNPT